MGLEWLAACNFCGSDRIESIDTEAQLWECQNCRYVFANPRPAFEEIVRFYSQREKYAHWLVEEDERDAIWKERVQKVLKRSNRRNLLDVGAGIGQFLFHARPLFEQVYGTEISASAVQIAHVRFDLALHEGVLETIPALRGQTFDNITLFHVLEHVHDPKRLMQQCRSRLNEGGLLFIAVPNEILSLKTRWLVLKMRIRESLGLGLEDYRSSHIGRLGIRRACLDETRREVHLSYFSAPTLNGFVEQNGFRLEESSLDRINLDKGWKFVRHQLYYLLSMGVLFVSGRNVYDTIWVVGRKESRE